MSNFFSGSAAFVVVVRALEVEVLGCAVVEAEVLVVREEVVVVCFFVDVGCVRCVADEEVDVVRVDSVVRELVPACACV